MLKTLKSTLVEIIDSKKALVLVAMVIAQVVGKFGFDFDQAAFDRIVLLASVYLGAQGYADHGIALAAGHVEAARVANDNATSSAALAPGAPKAA